MKKEKPSRYYEYLKESDPDTILKQITQLKRDMTRLKNMIENPRNRTDYSSSPTREAAIDWDRDAICYLEKLLADKGYTVKRSRKEEQAARFRDNLPFLKKLTFSIGGYFYGDSIYIVEVNENKMVCWSRQNSGEYVGMQLNPQFRNFRSERKMLEKNELQTLDQLLKQLKKLHIEDWDHDYSPKKYNIQIFDGTQWEIKFEFYNGLRTKRISGSNCYPYNFQRFVKIFSANENP